MTPVRIRLGLPNREPRRLARFFFYLSKGCDNARVNVTRMPEKLPQPKPAMPNPLVPMRSADDLIRDEATDEMKKLARTDPERVAKLLRDWMARR